MKLFIQLQGRKDSGEPISVPLQTGISLPRGCGIDVATEEIGKAADGLKRMAIEFFKADTEGREPDLEAGNAT